MSNKPKANVMVVLGTRPEAIKVAPLVREAKNDPHSEVLVVSTDQHTSLLESVTEDCGLTIDEHLHAGQPGFSIDDILTHAIGSLDKVIEHFQPDVAVVHGDTTTTLAGALADFHHHVPVVHLEAGLRTGDLASPFPEEANRKLVAQIASLHLAPTKQAKKALVKEGVEPSWVSVIGNTAIASLNWILNQSHDLAEPYKSFTQTFPKFALVTAHRRESWGEGLESIAAGVAAAADQNPDMGFLLPLHPNPKVRAPFVKHCENHGNLLIAPPAGYRDFSHLLYQAHVVLSDSGGVQEEAPAVETPLGILREVTERNEVVTSGQAVLLGTNSEHITHFVQRITTDTDLYEAMTGQDSPFGDAHASGRGLSAIHDFLNGKEISLGDQWQWAGEERGKYVQELLR